MRLEWTVKNVKSGKDKDECPYVEVILRTADFSAVTLSKYLVLQQTLITEIKDGQTN